MQNTIGKAMLNTWMYFFIGLNNKMSDICSCKTALLILGSIPLILGFDVLALCSSSVLSSNWPGCDLKYVSCHHFY